MPTLPATNLTDAFNACDPARPLEAGDPRWVDLAGGRGDEGSAVAQCRRRILRSDTPLVQLLAGHRGCGKSTELRRLQRSLERDGFFVAYFEVDADLDLEDTEPDRTSCSPSSATWKRRCVSRGTRIKTRTCWRTSCCGSGR